MPAGRAAPGTPRSAARAGWRRSGRSPGPECCADQFAPADRPRLWSAISGVVNRYPCGREVDRGSWPRACRPPLPRSLSGTHRYAGAVTRSDLTPPRLRVQTVPIEDPGPLLSRLPAGDAYAWVRHGDGLIGYGEVARHKPESMPRPTAWFSDLVGAPEITAGWTTLRPGAGLMAFGSFVFDPENTAGQSVLVVPAGGDRPAQRAVLADLDRRRRPELPVVPAAGPARGSALLTAAAWTRPSLAGGRRRDRRDGSAAATSARWCWPAIVIAEADERPRPALAGRPAGRRVPAVLDLPGRRAGRGEPGDAGQAGGRAGAVPGAGRNHPAHRR